MRPIPLQGDTLEQTRQLLTRSPLFASLSADQVSWLLGRAQLLEFAEYDTLIAQGEVADSFYVIVQGAVSVLMQQDDWLHEINRVSAPASVGEMGLLLQAPRTATVAAAGDVVAVRLDATTFFDMFRKVPAFATGISRSLAERLREAGRQIAHGQTERVEALPDPGLLKLLPMEFVLRHRVLPVRLEGNVLTLGFVEDPTAHALGAARRQLPSLELRTVALSAKAFDAVLTDQAAVDGWSERAEPPPVPAASGVEDLLARVPAASETGVVAEASPRLDNLLRRMVAEGASDLHLSAGHRPRWRLDGVIRELVDAPALGPLEVFELLLPTMTELTRRQFVDHKDADFGYALGDGSRFRLNLFRDHRGISAVARVIPNVLMTPQQLGLPPVVQQLCHLPKGLVLVTGPTGSGKSTSLAAMIDYINTHVNAHIITLEDPIEFVHRSKKALVNQREVGSHAQSFARALRAALREDPDIVLIGEMRDRETMALALETAGTGHLVFGTMHTSTAATTIDRIIGMFPVEQQPQIRITAAEVLKGVMCQTLCRRVGGGRVAAFEVLVVNSAVENLMREGKTHQLETVMTTARKLGNTLLNEDLARLVTQRKIDANEALARTQDRDDMLKRLKMAPGS